MKKHEWERVNSVKDRCKFCQSMRLAAVYTYPVTYWDKIKETHVYEEPECIERPEKEAGDNVER